MSSEERGFVFSVTFIVIFGLFLATLPAGLQGPGETPDMVIPVNPNLISDFSASVDYQRSDFTLFKYYYDLGGRSWVCTTDETAFVLAAKILVGGILWLGGLEVCKFISPAAVDRGETLTLVEIQADATDGTVRYSLEYSDNGNTAGGFVAYWNTTTYATAALAWAANGLYLLHGVGIDTTATANIGALLVGLLLLQLPDVPLLINVLIAVPIWAGVIYILWYIIKEMIPFV
jgi:hypothetical protein